MAEKANPREQRRGDETMDEGEEEEAEAAAATEIEGAPAAASRLRSGPILLE